MQSTGRAKSTIVILGCAIVAGAAVALFSPAPKPAVTPAPVIQKPVVAAEQTVPIPRSKAPSHIVAATDSALEKQLRQDEPISFVERAEGIFEASTPHYTALLSAAGGLQYFPKGFGGKPLSLNVKLQSVTQGDYKLFDGLADETADHETAVPKGPGLSFWHTPSFEENYEPRGNGIEQSFILETATGGVGALEFVCEVAATGLTPVPPRAGRKGGILYHDASGRVAARYGQVIVRDSAQNSIALEPLLSSDGARISFAVPGEWMAQAQFPILVDPLVGTDFAVSPNNPNGVAPPTICAGTNSFLVAWVDYANGLDVPVVVGSVVSIAAKANTPFAISNTVGIPIAWRFQRIEAAYDGSNWLIAWSDARLAGPGIRGAIIGSNGAVLNGTDFLIAATTGNVAEDPLVSFDGVNFVVAWTDSPPAQSGGSQVYYARVNTNGVAGISQVVKNLVSPSNQSLEYLVSQRPSGDTLLIYRELLESPVAHRAVRIAPDGSVRDGVGGTQLFKEAQESGGFGRPIGAVFTSGEWQILSSYDQTKDSSVFMHRINLSGLVTPPAGVFAEVGNGPTGLTLSGVLIDSFAPAFPGTNEWLFLRNEKVSAKVYHLLGKRVTFAGVDMDPIMFQVDTSTQGVIRNSVAAQSGDVFLAAWLDGRNAVAQPGDAANVAAAIIDATLAGSAGVGLVAVAGASPRSGEAGLSVAFDSTASVGSFDTLSWDFGDGTTSTLVSPTHVYKNNGTYLARLKLTKGAYSVVDSVVITIGTGGPVGGGGATPIGFPLDTTPPIVTGLFISTCSVNLDFKNLNNDRVAVTGNFDLTQLTDNITGKVASLAIGGELYSFNLDAKGQFKSDAGSVPMIVFTIDPVKGLFNFQLTKANIRSEMASLGALNQSISPAIEIDLPITISVDKLSASATVGTAYKSRVNVSGSALYGFLGAGSEVSGAFLISSFVGNETGNGEHNFTIKGRLIKPGVYKPAPVGNFDIYLGTYHVAIQSGAIFVKEGTLTYNQSAIKNGLKKFTIDLNSGIFKIQMLRIPSDILEGGSGLPLAKSGSNISDADLNLSFGFDLRDSPRLSAGRFIFINRKNSAAKLWKLR